VAVTTGTAPLTYDFTDSAKTVNFTGLLSTDSDGIITKWSWNFNDIYPSSASGALTSHRYNAPGVYYPVLTVTDDLGATASHTVTITVTGTPLANTCSLATISAEFIRVNSVSDAAVATIQVQDQYGNPLRGAVVTVAVSGLASSPKTQVRTDIMGKVTVASPNFKRGARGTVTFTVTSVASTTHKYVPADNDCLANVSKTR
jgi:PKD repeat protein